MIYNHRWQIDLLFHFRRLPMKSFSERVTYLSNLHLVDEKRIAKELEIQEQAEKIGIVRLSNRQRAIDRLMERVSIGQD
jgi:hypothetical protein